jgi:hypothetical protein
MRSSWPTVGATIDLVAARTGTASGQGGARLVPSAGGGQDAPRLYVSDGDPDGDWNGAVPDIATVEEAWRTWRTEVASAENLVADSDDRGAPRPTRVPLREVLVHMIEEYARHCGHADLLRERIDARISQ